MDSIYKMKPKELTEYLRQTERLQSRICDVLEENNVGGETFLSITRDDLIDLFPGDFLARKKIWDMLNHLKDINPSKKQENKNVIEVEYSPPVELKRSSSTASTMSNLSSNNSISDKGEKMPPVSDSSAKDLTSVQAATPVLDQKWQKFKFPIPPNVKHATELKESTRKQIIRDVYTCMVAKLQGEAITTDDFLKVAKIVCNQVPLLKDVEPLGYSHKQEYPYWGTVHYLLKRRHFNKKGTSEPSSVKPKKRKTEDKMEEKDIDNLHKQLAVEMKRKKVNEPAVSKLQELTFLVRKDDIIENFNGNQIEAVLAKYPFLKNEGRLLHELELHVKELVAVKEEASINNLLKKWKTLAPLLCYEEASEDRTSLLAIDNISNFFKCKPIIEFLKSTNDIDEEVYDASSTKAPQLMAFRMLDDDEDDEYDIEDVSGDQIFLVLDKQVFMEIDADGYSYSHALLLLLAMYYTFNLKYSDDQKPLFTFLEEHVLGIKPSRRSYNYRKVSNIIFKNKDRVKSTTTA